jgi:hypothetical protein
MKFITRLLAATLLFACGSASASFITMATEFSVSETSGGLELVISTENRGDEPAYGVQFEVQAGEKQFASPVVSRLGVNEKTAATFPVGNAFGLPGHYPVIIKTHYKDANAYPFSALTVGFYDYEQPVVSKILVRAEDVTIPSNGKGNVNFVIRNNDSVPRDVGLVLHLPDELAVVSERQSLNIAPRSEENLRFTVENFSALENSGYAITLVAEYEDGERHYSSAGSMVAQITGPSVISGRWIWVIAGAISVLVILLVVSIRKQRKQARI